MSCQVLSHTLFHLISHTIIISIVGCPTISVFYCMIYSYGSISALLWTSLPSDCLCFKSRPGSVGRLSIVTFCLVDYFLCKAQSSLCDQSSGQTLHKFVQASAAFHDETCNTNCVQLECNVKKKKYKPLREDFLFDLLKSTQV